MAERTSSPEVPRHAVAEDVGCLAFELAPLPLLVTEGAPLRIAAANTRFRHVVGHGCAGGTLLAEIFRDGQAARLIAAIEKSAASGQARTLPQVTIARADARNRGGARPPGVFDLVLEPMAPPGNGRVIVAAIDLASRLNERHAATVRMEEQASDLVEAHGFIAAAVTQHARTESQRDSLRLQLAVVEESERRRLARELHDQLGQHLTALALGLSAVAGGLPADSPHLERLTSLLRLTGSLSRDVRYLTLELRPPELDDVGLASAVSTYIEQWTSRFGIAVEFEVTGTGTAPSAEASSTIFRIMQEALTNVARHSEAQQVSVILELADDTVRLIVEDDGVGFDVANRRVQARAERRLGLAGMEERALLLGGVLEIESAPGEGTAVFATLPIAVLPL